MAVHADTSGRPALADQRWYARTPDLDQYRSYMQLILVGAAVVSLVIKEWSTGVLLLVLTLPRLIRPGHLPLPDCPQSRSCVCRDPPPRGQSMSSLHTSPPAVVRVSGKDLEG
jgi:hypothetical protein